MRREGKISERVHEVVVGDQSIEVLKVHDKVDVSDEKLHTMSEFIARILFLPLKNGLTLCNSG